MRLRNYVSALVLAGTAIAPLATAFAQSAAPNPEKLTAAAEEFDAGRRAYKQRDFLRAASHFENAFRDSPSAPAIRMAIRARQEAGDRARAATLCVRAQSLYSEDRETAALAQKVLREDTPKLQKVTVSCDLACTVVLDGKIVREDALASQILFTDPGTHELVAGWSQNRSESKSVAAKEGGAVVLEFQAPPEPIASQPAAPPVAPPVSSAPSGISSANTLEVDGLRTLPPIVFWVAAGVTVAVSGATLWSGLDTRANPGPDTVRARCAGLGTSCPEYQDGLSKERRTNYLLAGTAVGVVSTAAIGLLFTDWHRGSSHAGVERESRIVPFVDVASGGAGLSAAGRF